MTGNWHGRCMWLILRALTAQRKTTHSVHSVNLGVATGFQHPVDDGTISH